MADDLVVREWLWGSADTPDSWTAANDEHNALRSAYLAVVAERDHLQEKVRAHLEINVDQANELVATQAQLAAMTDERDDLWKRLCKSDALACDLTRQLTASEAAREWAETEVGLLESLIVMACRQNTLNGLRALQIVADDEAALAEPRKDGES